MDKKESKLNKHLPKQLGCVEDEKDDGRDLGYEDEIMGAKPIDIKSYFKQGYSSQEKYGQLIKDDQGSALDCVGENTSNDTEMSILIATGRRLHLDATDIYSQIRLPNGGASNRDAYRLLHKKGVSETIFNPRPERMTERHAKSRGNVTPDRIKNAKQHRIGAYHRIKSLDPEAIAHAIITNGGVGGGYKVGGVMGHSVFQEGLGYRDYRGLKLHGIKILDSYFPFEKWIVWYKRKIYLDSPRGQQIQLFSHWTAESNSDWIMMAQLYRKKDKQEVIAVIGNSPYWFKDISDFNNMALEIPWIKWENEKVVDEFPEEIRKQVIRIIGEPDLRTSINSQILGKVPEMSGKK